MCATHRGIRAGETCVRLALGCLVTLAQPCLGQLVELRVELVEVVGGVLGAILRPVLDHISI